MERPNPLFLHTTRLRAVWVCFAIIATVLLGIIGWGIYVTTGHDPRGAVAQFVKVNPLDFPVFYPATLPDGFRLDERSIVPLEGAGLQYALIDSAGKKVLVTQQQRPKLMEEVTKTQEFITSAGTAYIAELGGRAAGFLVTPETLVIVSSPEQADATVLRRIIEAMAPLS